MVTPYARKGPFTNGSATPPINKAFLDGLEDALIALTTTAPNTQNAITGWFHCDNYGAIGDGTTIDRAAIQAAMDAAYTKFAATNVIQRVYLPPRLHLVDTVAYYRDDFTVSGYQCLKLPDGVDFFGPGTIKVKDGAYGSGAGGAVFRSASSGVSHAKIREITIDGNKDNQVASTQCSNISLDVNTDVEIANTRHTQVNGNAIMCVGTTARPMTNVRIRENDISYCTMIGIQCSQFDGIDIDNNVVGYCTNNGIDIYGDNGTTTPAATHWRISNNRVFNCSVGIFPETAGYGIVSGNFCSFNSESGIHVNRFNGAPTGVTLMNNELVSSPYGIYISGDMFPGSVYVRGNTIADVTTAGIELLGSPALSYIYIDGNFIDTRTLNTVPLIHVNPAVTTWSQSVVLRTITKNTNRALDVYNQASTTATSVVYGNANV